MRNLWLAALVALSGCTTSFGPGVDGGDTAVDTALDTAADTAADSPLDSPEDTAVDTLEDTAADTAPLDTGTDLPADPPDDTAPDVPWDTAVDTAMDTVFDTFADTPADTSIDAWTDPVTDPVADGTCTSLTASLGGECNVVALCGCASSGYCGYHFDSTSCTAWEVCLPGAPPSPGIGEPCDYAVLNSCQPGLACIYDGAAGICYKWCTVDSDCPTPLTCSVDLYSGGCGTGVFSHRICFGP